ncbi:pilus biosynthesis protein (plasmid) [Escherichia coli]|nr:pilus biosynthesis protein [Escherichia coli]
MDNGRIVFYLTETRTYPLHMLNTKTSSSSSVSSGSTTQWGQQEARITQHPVMQRPLRAQPLVRNTICMKTSGKLLKQC